MGPKHLAKTSFLLLVGLVLLASLILFDLGQTGPAAQAASCWKAEITEKWNDLDLVGTVLRVAVQGKGGLPVYVRSPGGFEAVGFTGTKPEYGPNVAEFAPLSKGTYFIEPQGLGLVFQVVLDGRSYVRVDYRATGCATPTPAATRTPTPTRRPPSATPPQPRATATPTRAAASPAPPAPPAGGWKGRVVEHQKALPDRVYGTILVRVIGRPAGQQVEIRSGGWSATCTTGTKPEHGPDTCELGALNAGTYRLTPRDLGTSLDVTLNLQDFVRVEFYDTTPPPAVRWTGTVVQNTNGSQPTQFVNSAIAVVVAGKPWHQVEIRSGGWTATCQTGTKPEYGDACEFSALRAATYTITPKDLGASVQVTADGWGWALVRFEAVSVPPPAAPPVQTPTPAPPKGKTPTPTATASKAPPAGPGPSATPTATPGTKKGWQGWIVSNTSGQGGEGAWSVIIVRVLNYGSVPVHIDAGGGWSDVCVTGAKPEFGPDACSFGGLAAGTYTVRPEGSDLALQVTMDGLGTAELHFAKP